MNLESYLASWLNKALATENVTFCNKPACQVLEPRNQAIQNKALVS